MNFPRFLRYRPAAMLRVAGADAFPFLQGQFTQDLRPLGGRTIAYGLWLNQKGKVLADSLVLQDGACWWLVSGDSEAGVIQERLEAYVIADDVAISDESTHWRGFSFIGYDAGAWLESQGIELPASGSWAPLQGGMLYRGRRGTREAWEWLGRDEANLPVRLSDLAPLSMEDVERFRIEAGVPAVPRDVGPSDLPNEGGLESDAISYSKGCYLGQEVMARLKNLGQIRRRLVRIRGTGACPGRVGLLARDGRRVGEVRSAVPSDTGDGFLGLAMVQLLGLEPGAVLYVEGLPERTCTVEALR